MYSGFNNFILTNFIYAKPNISYQKWNWPGFELFTTRSEQERHRSTLSLYINIMYMIYFTGSMDIYILWPLTAAAFRESCWWQSVYWLPVNHWYFNIYLYREFFSFPRIIFFYLTSKTTFFEAKQLVEIEKWKVCWI